MKQAAAGADPTVELSYLAKMYMNNSAAKTKVLEAARKNWTGKKPKQRGAKKATTRKKK